MAVCANFVTASRCTNQPVFTEAGPRSALRYALLHPRTLYSPNRDTGILSQGLYQNLGKAAARSFSLST